MDGASLGFRSELIFHRAGGHVRDCRDEHGCLVITTPDNPSFFWGNYLLFDRAPRADDEWRWPALFERLIRRAQPQSKHAAFGWLEDEPGDVRGFIADGYTRDDATVMAASALRAVAAPSIEVVIRPFDPRDDNDWDALLRLKVATRDLVHAQAPYAQFAARQIAQWRALAAAGMGCWFGAWARDLTSGEALLAAALGIYVESAAQQGERIARYQSVATDAAFRRKGLCRALVAHAAHWARGQGAGRLVIVAAAGQMPERLYAALGFHAAGLQRGVQKIGY
jgi:GNAT superfamily N-acetyltransferase